MVAGLLIAANHRPRSQSRNFFFSQFNENLIIGLERVCYTFHGLKAAPEDEEEENFAQQFARRLLWEKEAFS